MYTKQKLQPLTNMCSTIGHQMESSNLCLTTIQDRLGKKDIQLILNFPNKAGN